MAVMSRRETHLLLDVERAGKRAHFRFFDGNRHVQDGQSLQVPAYISGKKGFSVGHCYLTKQLACWQQTGGQASTPSGPSAPSAADVQTSLGRWPAPLLCNQTPATQIDWANLHGDWTKSPASPGSTGWPALSGREGRSGQNDQAGAHEMHQTRQTQYIFTTQESSPLWINSTPPVLPTHAIKCAPVPTAAT